MSLKKSLGFVVVASLTWVVAYGCSSSKSTNTPITTHDAGHDTGGNMTRDTGLPDISVPDTGSGDGNALACPPMSTSTFNPMTYTNATAHQGVCAATDINNFIVACGDNGSETTCNTWQNANVAGSVDGGAGTTCGNCIFSPQNNGGTWTDPEMFFLPNYAACIQLTDPTNGLACAKAFDNISGCEGVACDFCMSESTTTAEDSTDCINAANMGSCSTYETAEQTACATDLADGGAAQTCSPGGGVTQNPDFTYIITLICGSADGG
jgi:hypothetical protein